MSAKHLLLIILAWLSVALVQAQMEEMLLQPQTGRRGSLGIGYGIPYGGIGVNADVYFWDSVALTAGIGSFGYSAGYAMGGKYLHGSRNKTFRPQFTLLYGVNGVVVVKDPNEPEKRETYTGFTAGLGAQVMFGSKKQHGFDADLLYKLSSGIFGRTEELLSIGYPVKKPHRYGFSVGYRYAFDLKL